MPKIGQTTPESDHSTDSAPIQLEAFLPYRLNQLSTEISHTLARTYSERFGLSIPEWRVLATLGQFGMITAREIGLHSRMHKTTISRAVAALEARKLLSRKANKQDMREAFLMLTEAGRAMYFEIVPMARHFADSLCQGLTPSELDSLNLLINKLIDRVGKIASSNGMIAE